MTIDGATLKGKMATSRAPWAGAIYAVSGKTIVRNAILESEFVAGGTHYTDREQGSVYVGKDATLQTIQMAIAFILDSIMKTRFQITLRRIRKSISCLIIRSWMQMLPL